MPDEKLPTTEIPKMAAFPFRLKIDPQLEPGQIRLVGHDGNSIELAKIVELQIPPPQVGATLCPVCDSPCREDALAESPLGPACSSCVAVAAELRSTL